MTVTELQEGGDFEMVATGARAQLGSPLLQLDAVHKRFGTHDVLLDIDLTLHAGEVMAIIGGTLATQRASAKANCIQNCRERHLVSRRYQTSAKKLAETGMIKVG